MQNLPILEFKNLSFTYQGANKPCIKSINLQIMPGEFVLLTGTSGSGKSSLTSCINGLIPNLYSGNLQGEVLLQGKKLSEFKSYELSEQIGSVFQDPRSQFFATDVISELAFSCENFGMPKNEILQRINAVSENLDIKKLWDKNVFQLSSGERQKLAIASVFTLQPKVLVFDEPSANLDYASCLELAKIFTLLKQTGHTIIIAEHRLFYLKNLVDKMCYIKNNKIDKIYTKTEFLHLQAADLQKLGLRQLDLDSLTPKTPSRFLAKSPQALLELTNISFSYYSHKPILENINYVAKGGEITAIVGANGAGKTTFAKLLTGLLKAKTGDIKINGIQVKPKNLYKKITFIMQDADYQLFTEDLKLELYIGNEKLPAINNKIDEALHKLNLTHLIGKHPAALSGGEKQRLTLALALVKDSDIIILDEPTSGLDAKNMQSLATACTELAQQGKIVFIITHDYEFILQTCNKIIYLNSMKNLESFDFNANSKSRLQHIFTELQNS